MKQALAGSKQSRASTKRATAPATPAREPEIISSHLTETIDPGRRHAMVAEAAYFYAEHRGFEPGHEMDDWLAAESEVEAALRLADMARR